MIVGFGAVSPVTGGDCPAGGSWEQWCDCMWPAGTTTNAKCHSKPWSIATPAPWTIVGANVRGIPHVTGLTIPGGEPVASDTDAVYAAEEASIFGMPKMIALAGGGILLLGGLSLLLSKRRGGKRLAGYRRRKKSRR